MSARDFKFVSPGVHVEEIDNSQLPNVSDVIGPLVIGRSRRGPAMQPVKVDSFSEFVTIFGNPVAGEEASDQWRSGVPTAPTFAAYAAQAWLRNNAPLTFIRLLGEQSPDAQDTNAAKAGWKIRDASLTNSVNAVGGEAYGLFLFNSESATNLVANSKEAVDGTLAAIFYATEGTVSLSGSIRGFNGTPPAGGLKALDGCTATGSAAMIFGSGSGGGNWTAMIYDGTNSSPNVLKKTSFSFDRTAPNYIRKVFNTNPTKTNSALIDTTVNTKDTVFLGQTFERAVVNTITSSNAYGIMLKLGASGKSVSDAGNFKFASQKARTGWFFSQDLRNTAGNATDVSKNVESLDPAFDPAQSESVTRLFKLHGLSSGEDLQRNFKVSIEDVKYSRNDSVPYGTFTLAIRDIRDNDNARKYVERYSNLSLDPNSEMYIAKQIGDRYYEFDTNSKRLIEYGSYPNVSKIVRVEMADSVDANQHDPECLPFGVEGPVKFSDFEVVSTLQHATNASATIMPDSTTSIDGLKLILTNADNTTHEITVTNGSGAATATTVDDALMGPGVEAFATQLKAALDLAVTAGTLDMTVSAITNADGTSSPRVITITQTGAGTAGNNKAIGGTLVSGDKILVNQTTPGQPQGDKFTKNGSDTDTDTSNGVITTTSPVTAGSGSAGSTSGLFHAATGAQTGQGGSNNVGVVLQSIARDEPFLPFTGSVSFPAVALRLSASDGDLSDDTEAYFGATTSRSGSNSIFEESIFDLLYPLPSGLNQTYTTTANNTKICWYFTLDDLVANYKTIATNRDTVYYQSGSRAAGYSMTAISGSYKKILDIGYNRFTSVFYNGFNGFDITEKEPFNATRALPHGSATETSHAMFYTTKRAVDMFSDPEYIESNILMAPGIVNEGLTNHMILTCEERGDALALIDPRGGYQASSESYETEQERMTSGTGIGAVSQHVVEVGTNMESRNLNSSYGATYYPWVRIQDTISGRSLWAPPSIAAIGALSFSEKASALWFAPAGFNRGGLSDGAAGIPVSNVRNRLTSAERDFLYERNINPIASFPNEGIVIFGQKTLQVTPSALDRINVRRLMIFVKKEISRIASQLLFDQNVPATWARFTGQVEPFLTNIKNNFGLDDFKVVLDETTTTPDLIDRNTIYAKIFLKPTRAVEFFAIDFVITNSGAGFED